MNDIQSRDFSLLLAPITAATTERTANLDCQGASYASIVLAVSAEANTNSTNVAVQLLESNDTTATNFATFNATYNVTVDNTAAAQQPFHVDLRGRKRYLRIKVTPDTTTNGAVITSAVAILDQQLRSTSDGLVG